MRQSNIVLVSAYKFDYAATTSTVHNTDRRTDWQNHCIDLCLLVTVTLLHCCSSPHSFADLANCYSFPGFQRQVRLPRKSAESPAILLDCQVLSLITACMWILYYSYSIPSSPTTSVIFNYFTTHTLVAYLSTQCLAWGNVPYTS